MKKSTLVLTNIICCLTVALSFASIQKSSAGPAKKSAPNRFLLQDKLESSPGEERSANGMLVLNAQLDWLVQYEIRYKDPTGKFARKWLIKKGNLNRPEESRIVDDSFANGIVHGHAFAMWRAPNGKVSITTYTVDQATNEKTYALRESDDEGETWKSVPFPFMNQLGKQMLRSLKWLPAIQSYYAVLHSVNPQTNQTESKFIILDSAFHLLHEFPLPAKPKSFFVYGGCATFNAQSVVLVGFYPYLDNPAQPTESPNLDLWRVDLEGRTPVRVVEHRMHREEAVQMYAGNCIIDKNDRVWLTPTLAFLDSTKDYGEILSIKTDFTDEKTIASTQTLFPGKNFGYFEAMLRDESSEVMSISGYYNHGTPAQPIEAGVSVIFDIHGNIRRTVDFAPDNDFSEYHFWYTYFVPGTTRTIALGYGVKKGEPNTSTTGLAIEF